MNAQPYFCAEPVGATYRGEVIDSQTYERIAVTAHTYPNEVVAKAAAKAMWQQREDVA